MNAASPEPASRNAPCPCGSGLRYKACCAVAADRADAGEGPLYPGWDALSDGRRRQLRERLRQALDAQNAGRLEIAGDLYRDVIAQAPDTYDALHMLGVICYQSGRLDEALRHLRRALELTDWRVAAMRHNLALVVDAAMARLARDAGAEAAASASARSVTHAAPAAAATTVARAAAERATAGRSVPRISVLVSTFNGAACLPACLADLERQTIAEAAEIIVIDSGSEQDEHAIARAFEGRFRNLVYLRTRRETLHAAWNRGIALARGTYLTNANTDDAHRPDALARMVAALDANPEADFAYCDYAWTAVPNATFDDPRVTRTVRHRPYHPAQTLFYCILGCHPVWRRTLFASLGEFDPELRAIGDYDLLLRAVAAGRRPVHVAEVLSLFYQNPQGLTFQSDHASRELAAIQGAWRARMPIERVYDVGAARPADVASAWTALGVLGTSLHVPWLDVPHADLAYAAFCFRRALNADPAHAPALENLAALYGAADHRDYASALLARLPVERARRIEALVGEKRYVFSAAPVAPAHNPLRYPDSGE